MPIDLPALWLQEFRLSLAAREQAGSIRGTRIAHWASWNGQRTTPGV